MNDHKDFLSSYGMVFAPKGIWIDADGKSHSIANMEPAHLRGSIDHLKTAIRCMEAWLSSDSKTLFAGKHAPELVTKMEELGLFVQEVSGEGREKMLRMFKLDKTLRVYAIRN